MGKPTESELEILQVLWSQGASTVRTVNERLNAVSSKEIGYTTTLKLMQLMVEKGLLQRDTSARTHIYVAAVEEQSVKRNLLQQFGTAPSDVRQQNWSWKHWGSTRPPTMSWLRSKS